MYHLIFLTLQLAMANLWWGRWSRKHKRIEVPREQRPDDGDVNLARALQYAPATGLARTQKFIREFTERVHAPAYEDWTTLVDTGNMDG